MMWRIKQHKIQLNHSKAKQLACLLDMADSIRVPGNDDEENKLKWICDTYDSLINDINGEIDQVRRWMS